MCFKVKEATFAIWDFHLLFFSQSESAHYFHSGRSEFSPNHFYDTTTDVEGTNGFSLLHEILRIGPYIEELWS